MSCTSAEDSAEKLERQGQLSTTVRSIFRRDCMDTCTSCTQGEGTEPLVHMTTSVVGRLRRKSAAVSDRSGSVREQPSMNMVTVKFGGPRGWMDTRSVFFWGPGFPVLSRRIT